MNQESSQINSFHPINDPIKLIFLESRLPYLTTYLQKEINSDENLDFSTFMVIAVEGKGGFGVVFRLFDRQRNREFAIKIQHHQSSISNLEIEIYKKMGSLRAYVPIIYRYGRAVLTNHFNDIKEKSESMCNITFESKGIADSDSVSYILMEAGICSLLDVMNHKSITDALWSEEEIIMLLNDMSSALSSLKKERIAHCDIKPGNIIITEDGCYKLADFGISLDLKKKDNSVEGNSIGTADYMAPEIGVKHDPLRQIFTLLAWL